MRSVIQLTVDERHRQDQTTELGPESSFGRPHGEEVINTHSLPSSAQIEQVSH